MTRTAIEQLQLEETQRHNRQQEQAGILGGIGSLVGGIGKGLAGAASVAGAAGKASGTKGGLKK